MRTSANGLLCYTSEVSQQPLNGIIYVADFVEYAFLHVDDRGHTQGPWD